MRIEELSILLNRLGNKRTMATITEVKFHDITIEDKAWMDARFAEDGRVLDGPANGNKKMH